jgi:DNA modification methylase/ParB-like chromosome segregation protein Spo0J
MAARIALRPVAELRAHPGNARRHDAAQIEQIKASMLAFGFTNPLLVDEAGLLIAGHGRLAAAIALGLDRVPAIVLRHLSAAQKEALRLADNRIAENATWDQALLREALAAVQAAGEVDLAALGFSAAELADILAAAGEAVSDGDAPEALSAPAAEQPAGTLPEPDADDPADAAPVAPRQAVARVGDIWRLGAHRLACGDSTNRATVARVMAAERAALLFTSPPYGNQRHYTTGGVADWDALMQGVFQHLADALQREAQVLVNLGLIHRDGEWQPYWQGWLDWMRAQGWRRFGLYAWDQGPGLPGDWSGRLAPAFELVFHFNREARAPNKIVPCKWAGTPNHGNGLRAADGGHKPYTHLGLPVQEMRIPDSVLRIGRHKARGIETEHPAVFPVALPEFLMRAFTDEGDVVFEPFAGSGTTILAGERCGRRVRAIELAPTYVDLAIARWRMLHPEQPVTLDDENHGHGPSYDAVAAERAEAVADAA